MNIKWTAWMAGVFLLLTALPALAWRCEHGFVDTGDSAATVRKQCGPPDFIYGGTSARRGGRAQSADEHWYYNPGPSQLLRILHFRGGVLEQIDTAGYGFNPSPRRCTPQDIRTGMNVYELVTRCGKPKNKHTYTAGAGKRSSGSAASRTEIWTYDFGSQYLLQKITISSGDVQSVETAHRDTRRSKPRN